MVALPEWSMLANSKVVSLPSFEALVVSWSERQPAWVPTWFVVLEIKSYWWMKLSLGSTSSDSFNSKRVGILGPSSLCCELVPWREEPVDDDVLMDGSHSLLYIEALL